MLYMITDPAARGRAFGRLFDDVEAALDEGHAITHECGGQTGLYFVTWLPDHLDIYDLDADELDALEHRVAKKIRRDTGPAARRRAYERAYNRRAV